MPALLVIAWNGHAVPFLVVFTCALLTDLFDGFLARRLHQESPLGARLDSWGDFAVYMATPLCAWWLWPDLVAREAVYVITVIASFTLPVLVGFCRFRMLTSYHTWGAKLTAVLMSVSTFLLFAGGSPWPFRCSTVILVLAQLEEIAISLVIPELRSNIPTLWHALRLAKGCPSNGKGRKYMKVCETGATELCSSGKMKDKKP